MFLHFFIFLPLLLTLIIKCEGCASSKSFCSTLYYAECCTKIYDSAGAPLSFMNGSFCNMQDAVYLGDPYPVGCCQTCLSAGEGCTADLICCPGYGQVSDPSCPDGQYMCNKTSDSEVKNNKCFTEGQYCKGKSYTCCSGYLCNTTVDYGSQYGKCELDPDYTGQLPEPTKPIDLPTIPVDPKCYSYPYITTPTPAPTDAPSTGAPCLCAGEGMRCEKRMCCANLECPTNWLPLGTTRWVLNWFGVWYKVCRDYPSFAWYNPFTWYDY